jgi:hypothetical protein
MLNQLAKQAQGLPLSRGERLGVHFREAVDRIESGRSAQLDPGELADYVALGWLQGSRDDFRLTVVGACVYNELLRVWSSRTPG